MSICTGCNADHDHCVCDQIAASRQSRSKALLAALIYHEGKAAEANVYMLLHSHMDDNEMVEYWTRERNKHTDMANAIDAANKGFTDDSA